MTWVGISTVGLIALASLLVGAWLWTRVLHRWIIWRNRPRESREERRRRRCRVAIHNAEDLLEGEFRHLALRYARAACRLDPANAQALFVLGLCWRVQHRHELALKCFEEAYRLIEHEYRATNDYSTKIVPEIAIEAARTCARMRIEAKSELEKEEWSEQVLEWAAVAVDDDPEMASCLMDDPLLRELRTQVRLMPAYTETS